MNNQRPSEDRGLTLIELLAILVVIGVLAGLLLPTTCPGIGKIRLETCAWNLELLYEMSPILKNPIRVFPRRTGFRILAYAPEDRSPADREGVR
jgi:prepilin-type N-terminal cleavage/methylation domain-containing protein